MNFFRFVNKSDIALRLNSLGLQLTTPSDIHIGACQPEYKEISYTNELTQQSGTKKWRGVLPGQLKNATTLNYKTLKPEPGGLFCYTIFGIDRGNQDRRYYTGYIKLAAPMAHIWYLKGSPSYVSMLLRKTRQDTQSIVYMRSIVSFPIAPWDYEKGNQFLVRYLNLNWLSSNSILNYYKSFCISKKFILNKPLSLFTSHSMWFSIKLPFQKSLYFKKLQEVQSYTNKHLKTVKNSFSKSIKPVHARSYKCINSYSPQNQQLNLKELSPLFYLDIKWQNFLLDNISISNAKVSILFPTTFSVNILDNDKFFNTYRQSQIIYNKNAFLYLETDQSKKFKLLFGEKKTSMFDLSKQKLKNRTIDTMFYTITVPYRKSNFTHPHLTSSLNPVWSGYQEVPVIFAKSKPCSLSLTLFYKKWQTLIKQVQVSNDKTIFSTLTKFKTPLQSGLFWNNYYLKESWGAKQKYFWLVYLYRYFVKSCLMDLLYSVLLSKQKYKSKYQQKQIINQMLRIFSRSVVRSLNKAVLYPYEWSEGLFERLTLPWMQRYYSYRGFGFRKMYPYYPAFLQLEVDLSEGKLKKTKLLQTVKRFLALNLTAKQKLEPLLKYKLKFSTSSTLKNWLKILRNDNVIVKKNKRLKKFSSSFDERVLRPNALQVSSQSTWGSNMNKQKLELTYSLLKFQYYLKINNMADKTLFLSSTQKCGNLLFVFDVNAFYTDTKLNSGFVQTSNQFYSLNNFALKEQLFAAQCVRVPCESFLIGSTEFFIRWKTSHDLNPPTPLLQKNSSKIKATRKTEKAIQDSSPEMKFKLLIRVKFGASKVFQPRNTNLTTLVDRFALNKKKNALKRRQENSLWLETQTYKKPKPTYFNFVYIPLTYRYCFFGKHFLMRFDKQQVFQVPIIPYANNPLNSNKKITNPLGHKNFRLFVLKKFRSSIIKAKQISQFKTLSYQLMIEKTYDSACFTISESIKQWQDLNLIEKDKLLFCLLKNFYPDFQKNARNMYWSILERHKQMSFVCGNSKSTLHCFEQNSAQETSTERVSLNRHTSVFSSQKKNLDFKAYQTLLTRPYGLLEKVNDFSLDLSELSVKSLFMIPLISKGNRSKNLNCNWLKTNKVHQIFHAKKRILNRLITKICHKIDVYMARTKSTLLMRTDEWFLKSHLDYYFKQHYTKDFSQWFDEESKQHEIQKQWTKKPSNSWLKRLGVDLPKNRSNTNQNKNNYITVLECIKKLYTFFSLKTKLIKSKAVRALFAYRLLNQEGVGQQVPNLQTLLWVVSPVATGFKKPKKTKIALKTLDRLLYNRVVVAAKSPNLRYLKNCFSSYFESFLKESPEFNRNPCYFFSESFSWPFFYDLLQIYKFTHPLPGPSDLILPCYLERVLIFDQQRTGGWAIHTLLQRFKQKPLFVDYLNQTLEKSQLKHSVCDAYYYGFYTQVTALNKKIDLTQKFVMALKSIMTEQHTKPYFLYINRKDETTLKTGVATAPSKLLNHFSHMITALKMKRTKFIRQLKVISPFRQPNNDPTSVLLTYLPVLPPDLRPIMRLEGGQFAMSDLNKLYQQIIYRNSRLEELLQVSGSSHSRFFNKVNGIQYRLTQESIDALLDNGKSDSKPIVGTRGQPLKSLSEILRGKKGRFRQNLLGKRVDYSGRSVIVVGPQLKIHQCGLPKEMALELFQPFLIRQLIAQKYEKNFTRAKIFIQQNSKSAIIWSLLDQILEERPILLNRAPTLHRLGIQAFQPKLVSGRAILLHPLVCNAFNADFDGDQMAVHVPLSFDACSEAWKLMWSRNNIFSPSTGDPILMPTQDMVLGSYYLTTWDRIRQEAQIRSFNSANLSPNSHNTDYKKKWFSQLNTVTQLVHLNKLELHQIIWIKWSSTFEFEFNYQSCFEFQLTKSGHASFFYEQLYSEAKLQDLTSKTFCSPFDVDQNKNTKVITNVFQTWIKTTPGRVIMNQLLLNIG